MSCDGNCRCCKNLRRALDAQTKAEAERDELAKRCDPHSPTQSELMDALESAEAERDELREKLAVEEQRTQGALLGQQILGRKRDEALSELQVEQSRAYGLSRSLGIVCQERDEARAKLAAYKVDVRGHAIDRVTMDQLICNLCGDSWADGDGERHGEGCPADPRESQSSAPSRFEGWPPFDKPPNLGMKPAAPEPPSADDVGFLLGLHYCTGWVQGATEGYQDMYPKTVENEEYLSGYRVGAYLRSVCKPAAKGDGLAGSGTPHSHSIFSKEGKS